MLAQPRDRSANRFQDTPDTPVLLCVSAFPATTDYLRSDPYVC